MIILELFIFFTLLANVFMPNIILQKTKHIFRRMTVVQFPVRHCPIRYSKKLAKFLAVHSCTLPQFPHFTLTIHLIIPISKKLCVAYSLYHMDAEYATHKFIYQAAFAQIFSGISLFAPKSVVPFALCCSSTW